ncbi:MAG: tRNA 4-thiouridine(8) synthase ThiI, partial [Spirochaetales bacterium]|nr:tRNA 4-thiouridine(8) synthase ThiI [Spirochaetales bacterium]
IYGAEEKGTGGLPVGSAGKGMLLLSGGIDSPVAGYLMAKRGLRMDAVYFHAYPYTSDDALLKVKSLAEKIAPYLSGLSLFVVSFTDFQLLLKQKAREEEITLLMRAGMVKIAEIISKIRGNICLVTGESLSQVASQTVESINYTGSETDLTIFRPLIGMDKEDIIKIAKSIDTFETSILPFEDCCTIFSFKHPRVNPDTAKLKNSFLMLEGEGILREAAEKAERIYFKP